MVHQPPSKPLLLRLQLALASARFFSFSLLIHVFIVIIAGSAVIIHVQESIPDFSAGDGSLVDTTVTAEPPNDPTSKPEITSPMPVVPDVAKPLLDVISVSSSMPSTFQVQTGPSSRVAGNLTGASSNITGVGDKIANLTPASGIAGGTMRFFGQKEKTVNSLVGTFYDLKQTRRKKPTDITPDEYHKVFRRFVDDNWRESILSDYFRAPQPLYATQVMIPNMSADEGPKAFGMEKEVQPSRWLVHYQGKVSPPADGTYHFVGAGDDVMVVRFNGKVVLDRCWYQQDAPWKPERNYNYGWTAIPNGFAKGDPVRLKAGTFYDIEILIGEQPGGLVFACLLVEKEGEQYDQDGKGNPILPVFRLTTDPMPELQKGQTLPPYAQNGPVWKATSNDRNRSGSALDRFRAMNN